MNEKLVCGKCGSSNVNIAESLSTDGWSGEIASCFTCGNTSESKKYGFKREGSGVRDQGIEEKEEKNMALKGDCGNCPRKDVPISKCNPPLCWTCQKAAQGKTGDDRQRALADIRERVIVGDMPRPGGRGGKHVKVEAKTKKDTKKGAIAAGSPLQKAPKVEENTKAARMAKLQDMANFLAAGRIADGIRDIIYYYRPERINSVIILDFQDEDHKLLKAIEDQAQQHRRTLDQQILWLCQNELKIHEELLKEQG